MGVVVSLRKGDVALHGLSRGVRLSRCRRLLLRSQNRELRRAPDRWADGHGHLARLLDDHGDHVVGPRLMAVVLGHVLGHGRRGHRIKGAAGLTHELIWVLHGNLMIGHSLMIMLTGHSRSGRHWMRIDGSVHDVRGVLKEGGL